MNEEEALEHRARQRDWDKMERWREEELEDYEEMYKDNQGALENGSSNVVEDDDGHGKDDKW